MVERVDLTEDRVFQGSNIRIRSEKEEVTHQVICWLGKDYSSPETLREKAKDNHRYEQELIHESTPDDSFGGWRSYRLSGADGDGDTVYYKINPNDITSSYVMLSNTNGSRTTAGTNITSWTTSDTGTTIRMNNTTYQYNYRYDSLAPMNYLTSNGNPNIISYSIRYDNDIDVREPTREERLREVQYLLWGSAGSQPKLFRCNTEELDPFPWYSVLRHERAMHQRPKQESTKIFPWFPEMYIQMGREEESFENYKKELYVFNKSLRTTKGNPAEIFDKIGVNDPYDNWTSWIEIREDGSFDYPDNGEPLPWIYEYGGGWENYSVTDGNYVVSPSDLHNPVETSSIYTEAIRDCLPWMIDMLRDVWRETINQDLVEDYFKDHWHFITIPELRDRWYEGTSEKKEEETHLNWSVDGTFTINSNASTMITTGTSNRLTNLNIAELHPASFARYDVETDARPQAVTEWTIV